MRIAIVLAALVAACGGPALDTEPGSSAGETGLGVHASAASLDLAKSAECHGLKPAHCFCRVTAGSVFTTGSPDQIIDPHIEGQPLFTFVIPGKCYSQQTDLWSSHFGRGCWRDCRDAFGVEGATAQPGVLQDVRDASKELFALGACGSGWMDAEMDYSVGTNKPRPATGAGIGIGLRGSVVVVGGKKQCR